MENIRTCFFTGHRRLPTKRLDEIKNALSSEIERLIIEYDVRDFISGGALGFDTVAAEAVVKMKEKYPHIRLLLYLPCYGQSKKWYAKQKYRYAMLKSKADEIIYVTEGEYTEDCMMKRNLRMIKDAFFCIAFCIMHNTGTGITLKNAKEVGVRIINIADEIYESN